MSIDKILQQLLSLNEQEEITINWYDGGGGLVTKVGDKWQLEYVAQYGGMSSHEGSYDKRNLKELISKCFSWN